MTRALIVGKGPIGKALDDECASRGWKSNFLEGKDYTDYLENYDQVLGDFDIVFLAISNKGGGKDELQYLLRAIRKGKAVVTAAKAAQAYYFHELQPYLDKFKATASVGGGSRQLDAIDRRGDDHLSLLTSIQNGSLNFTCWHLQKGTSREEIYRELKRQGLIESGSKDFISAIRSEIEDSIVKATISYNRAQLGKTTNPMWFSRAEISDNDLLIAMGLYESRLITRISKLEESHSGTEVFRCKVGDCFITGTFQKYAGHYFPSMDITDMANACIAIRSQKGIIRRSGPGAGPLPTVEVMMQDAEALLQMSI